MNNFLNTVAISYVPLHEKAVKIAKEVGIVEVKRDNKKQFAKCCREYSERT